MNEYDEDGVITRRGVFSELDGWCPTYLQLMRLFVDLRIESAKQFDALNRLVWARDRIVELTQDNPDVEFLNDIDKALWSAGFDQEAWDDWEATLGWEIRTGLKHDMEKND